MSVPKNKRYESPIEYIQNAQNLLEYTIKKCSKFPKSYTFYLSIPIADLAREGLRLVIKANDNNCKNKYELQIRVNDLMAAYSEIHNMVPLIKLAKDIFDLKDTVMIGWMSLIDKELKLINGSLKSCRQRYSSLPDGPSVDIQSIND